MRGRGQAQRGDAGPEEARPARMRWRTCLLNGSRLIHDSSSIEERSPIGKRFREEQSSNTTEGLVSRVDLRRKIQDAKCVQLS